MRSLRYRLFPGFLILMLASAPSTGFAQGIFRCTTGDGQVRFSDKQAPDGNCETVEVAPGPDDSRMEEASEIEQSIKESADALTEDRHKREAKREKLAEERRKREEKEEEKEKARQQREDAEQEYNNWRYRGTWPIYPPQPMPPIHPPEPGPEPELPIEQPGRPSQLNPPLRSSGTPR